MQKELTALGLGEDEAKMYIALLEIGETPAGELIKKTGLHRQIVYTTLEKLAQRDFVKVIVKRKTKHWSANDPHILLREAQEREAMAKELVPKLLSLGALAKQKQAVRLYENDAGLAEMLMRQMQSAPIDSEYLVIGSSPLLYTTAMKRTEMLSAIEAVRIQRRVKMKLIFSEKERENAEMAFRTYFSHQPKGLQREYRYLPERFDSPIGIHIWKSAVELVIYGDVLLCIEIENKDLPKDFLTYFEYLWKMAKE
jgi:sugar-specific transcriptional regulator TrmB